MHRQKDILDTSKESVNGSSDGALKRTQQGNDFRKVQKVQNIRR